MDSEPTREEKSVQTFCLSLSGQEIEKAIQLYLRKIFNEKLSVTSAKYSESDTFGHEFYIGIEAPLHSRSVPLGETWDRYRNKDQHD